MRLIAFLFLIFLSLHSYLVFAQVSTGPSAPNPNCPTTAGIACVNSVTVGGWSASCASNPGWAPVASPGVCSTGEYPMACSLVSSCTCEAPYKFEVSTVEGVTQGACVPDTCPNGYPKVDGQCPVCPTGHNEDGTCKDESASSASSSPTSSPNSSAASSVDDGDDGDDGNDGGGGGGNNNGGSNGGGSASSAASSQSGGAASSAASSGKGQCDPTAKNYLACIGSEKMNGDATAWEPVSANGNWLPVNENSPCVNKYQDSSGQWWCAAPSTNTPSSASGACDPTSTNYASCINSGATSSSGSSGGASSEDAEGLANTGDELIDGLQQDIDSELTDFEQAYTDDIDAFKRDGVPFDDEPSAIKSVLISFLPVSTSCVPPKLEFFGETHELDCYYFDVFKQALGWFLAIITAFQIWQMAIRPVER